MEITARNTNELAPVLYKRMDGHGVRVETRNGPAKRLPGVTTITLRHPWERVNFGAVRDANPFFHLIEAMAMLAGDVGNDVELLSYFAKNMLLYSDDGKEYNAFYGTRMRHYESSGMGGQIDQLKEVCAILHKDPESRQACVCLWDPDLDLGTQTKDKACNVFMAFEVENGRVNMTTFNRSNDAIFGGVTGANVVHFSFFQEYVACALDLEMGVWHHSSANLHVYLSNPKWPGVLEDDLRNLMYPDAVQIRLFKGYADEFDVNLVRFIQELRGCIEVLNKHEESWVEGTWGVCNNRFLNFTCVPMARAFIQWKLGNKQAAYDLLFTVESTDWKVAGLLWFKRRQGITISPHLLSYPNEFFTA